MLAVGVSEDCRITYTRDTRVPVVEGGKVVNQVHESGDLALGVVTHDLTVSGRGVDARVTVQLALHEADVAGLQSAVGNGSVIRGESSVELEVVASDGVVRVVQDGVEVLGGGVPLLAAGVVDILRVRVRAVVGGVVETSLGDTTQNVVEAAVLQQNPDNVLNLVLQVGNGLGGTRCVAEGSGGAAGNNSAQSAAGETEQGNQSVGLHDD